MQEQLTVAVSRGHGNEVLEQRSCSTLITMYEMHGQLIIINERPRRHFRRKQKVVAGSNLIFLGSPTETVTEP